MVVGYKMPAITGMIMQKKALIHCVSLPNLFKKPMVVGYKMPAITGMIMQKKALIHCVSLPNILLGENVVPEFLQFFCEPDAISYALEDAINNEARRKMLVERFSAMHESLLADTANLAADVIVGMARH